MDNSTKLLSNLANVEEVIKDEYKALILLSSLSNKEYETFVLTLINGKTSLSYNDVSTALVNHEVRRKDKESSSSRTITEVLTARGRVPILRRVREMLVSPKLISLIGKEPVCFLQGRRTMKD